jgi:hypothetical protein
MDSMPGDAYSLIGDAIATATIAYSLPSAVCSLPSVAYSLPSAVNPNPIGIAQRVFGWQPAPHRATSAGIAACKIDVENP